MLMQTAFTIANNYVPDSQLKLVAQAVLRAQDIQEESWDRHTAAYLKPENMSASEAVTELNLNPIWSGIISYWNTFGWNDCQSWAQGILAQPED